MTNYLVSVIQKRNKRLKEKFLHPRKFFQLHLCTILIINRNFLVYLRWRDQTHLPKFTRQWGLSPLRRQTSPRGCPFIISPTWINSMEKLWQTLLFRMCKWSVSPPCHQLLLPRTYPKSREFNFLSHPLLRSTHIFPISRKIRQVLRSTMLILED